MTHSTVIREANLADVSDLSGIIRTSYGDVAKRFSLTVDNCPKHPSNCTEAWVEGDMSRGVQYFLMETDGVPVGCVALESPNQELCYLERLSVLPKMQRQGLGQLLVQHALKRAKTRGVSKVSIGIINKQSELKNWYQGFGFREVKTQSFPHLPFRVCFMTYAL